VHQITSHSTVQNEIQYLVDPIEIRLFGNDPAFPSGNFQGFRERTGEDKGLAGDPQEINIIDIIPYAKGSCRFLTVLLHPEADRVTLACAAQDDIQVAHVDRLFQGLRQFDGVAQSVEFINFLVRVVIHAHPNSGCSTLDVQVPALAGQYGTD